MATRAARPTRQLHADASTANLDDLGRKGPQFLTMGRAEFAAYEYLCRQTEAKEWIETIFQEKVDDDFWKALADGVLLCKLSNVMWPNSIPKYPYISLFVNNADTTDRTVTVSSCLRIFLCFSKHAKIKDFLLKNYSNPLMYQYYRSH